MLQNVLALLVLLRRLIGAVILPSYYLFALSAADVADDVAAGGHVTFAGFTLLDVDYGVEVVGFAMLAAEILGNVREDGKGRGRGRGRGGAGCGGVRFGSPYL